MKKNDFSSEQNFEKILKEKMNELSASVDCFDKISARAFPEKDPDFSECGLTVTDLENVTGKRRIPPVFRWVSAAAAIVLCIGIIPKTAIINKLRDPAEKTYVKTTFNDLIREISTEEKSGEYLIYDIPLDDYISRDVLITPLYSCPFEKGSADMNVRLYIRNFNGISTNQIYAVKYRGEYSEENIIEAAETGVSFSDKEISDLKSSFMFSISADDDTAAAAANAFKSDSGSNLTDSDGKEVSAASFSAYSAYKAGKNTDSIRTDVIYYHYNSDDTYYYDMKITDDSENVLVIDRDSWVNHVSRDGSTTISADDSNRMKKVNLFRSNYEKSNDIYLFTPGCFYSWSYKDISLSSIEFEIKGQDNGKTTAENYGNIILPDDTSLQRNLRIYLGRKTPFTLSYEDRNETISKYYTTANCDSTENLLAETDENSDKILKIFEMTEKLENELTQLENQTFPEFYNEYLEAEKERILFMQNTLMHQSDMLMAMDNQQQMEKIEEERRKNEELEEVSAARMKNLRKNAARMKKL